MHNGNGYDSNFYNEALHTKTINIQYLPIDNIRPNRNKRFPSYLVSKKMTLTLYYKSFFGNIRKLASICRNVLDYLIERTDNNKSNRYFCPALFDVLIHTD